MATLVSHLAARPMRSSDTAAVADLINDDRLPGQPEATAEMLAGAPAGRSPVDVGSRDELESRAVDVLSDPAGVPVGVISYATRRRDDAGLILWLHGHENPDVVDALLEHALAELGNRPTIDAFGLGAGLDALPVRHRAVTANALAAHGFVGHGRLRYMHRELPARELPTAPPADTRMVGDEHQLEVRDGEQVVAEATVSIPMTGLGVLRWISVDPAARGRHLGLRMLGSALGLLTELGAKEAVLHVDDAPTDERGRAAANRLCDKAGFDEIDRLHSFQRQRTA